MTDLYEQRIDAMKARERAGNIGDLLIEGQEYRNAERLAAYKRKRVPYDVCMCGEYMAKHTEGHGHTPVSMGDYHDS